MTALRRHSGAVARPRAVSGATESVAVEAPVPWEAGAPVAVGEAAAAVSPGAGVLGAAGRGNGHASGPRPVARVGGRSHCSASGGHGGGDDCRHGTARRDCRACRGRRVSAPARRRLLTDGGAWGQPEQFGTARSLPAQLVGALPLTRLEIRLTVPPELRTLPGGDDGHVAVHVAGRDGRRAAGEVGDAAGAVGTVPVHGWNCRSRSACRGWRCRRRSRARRRW